MRILIQLGLQTSVTRSALRQMGHEVIRFQLIYPHFFADRALRRPGVLATTLALLTYADRAMRRPGFDRAMRRSGIDRAMRRFSIFATTLALLTDRAMRRSGIALGGSSFNAYAWGMFKMLGFIRDSYVTPPFVGMTGNPYCISHDRRNTGT